MKLTVNTEMGGFEFNLSQTSVIYLLGVAQQLEDEGKPDDKSWKNNVRPGAYIKKADTKTPEQDVDGVLVDGDGEYDLIQKAKETILPQEQPESEWIHNTPMEKEKQTRDYQTPPSKDRHNNMAEEKPDVALSPSDGKYKGFMMIRCEQCGKTRAFNAKEPIDEYECRDCCGKTKLKNLRRMFVDCKCGRHYKYYTNETAEVITKECITCGYPVDMMLNSRRTAYVSIGGGY